MSPPQSQGLEGGSLQFINDKPHDNAFEETVGYELRRVHQSCSQAQAISSRSIGGSTFIANGCKYIPDPPVVFEGVESYPGTSYLSPGASGSDEEFSEYVNSDFWQAEDDTMEQTFGGRIPAPVDHTMEQTFGGRIPAPVDHTVEQMFNGGRIPESVEAYVDSSPSDSSPTSVFGYGGSCRSASTRCNSLSEFDAQIAHFGLDICEITNPGAVSPFSPSPPSPTSSTTSYSSTTSSTTTSSTSSEKRRAKLATFRAKRGPHPTSTNLAHACPEPDCSYTFERPGELTKHRRGQHQRPYKCTFDTCRYFSHGFQSNKDRERHLASQHNPEAPKVPCGYLNCKYETNRPDNLPKHRAAVHKIETKPSRTVMRKNPTVPKQPAKRKGRPRKHRQPSPPAGGA